MGNQAYRAKTLIKLTNRGRLTTINIQLITPVKTKKEPAANKEVLKMETEAILNSKLNLSHPAK